MGPGAGRVFTPHDKVVIPQMSTETPVQPAGEPGTPTSAYLRVENSSEFANLRKTFRSFVFPMTVAFFVWYALYVILSAYARGFMGTKIVGNINVALVFGLLQFLTTFLLAWLYSRYASQRLDPLADRLRTEVESGGDRS
jgi:uncharacterized membrane protein (DUF485 family)